MITHIWDTPQSVGLLWTRDRLVAETSTWQHSQETDIHAPGGIRTHNPSKRAAEDPRLRPHGHWYRPYVSDIRYKLNIMTNFTKPKNNKIVLSFVYLWINWNAHVSVRYGHVVGRDSVVGIQSRYGPGIESRWGRNFPHPSRLAHPASCAMGTASPGAKTAGTWRSTPTSI